MIVYSKTCLACTNKTLWKMIKQFAKEHGLTVEVRRINRRQHTEEAAQYEIEPPFVVHNGVALSLTEDLENIL